MNRERTFVFFFPYHLVSGIPVLFSRLAYWITTNTDYQVCVIDYPDGYMAKTLKDSKVRILGYSPDRIIDLPENSVLILQSDLPWGLPKNLKVSSKVTAFFWNCFPYNLIPVLPAKGRIWMSQSHRLTKFLLNTFLISPKIKCAHFLKLALSKNAIAFMDGTNKDFTEKMLGVEIPAPVYLPIPVSGPFKSGIKNHTSKQLHFVWIGRLADFKVFSLIYALNSVSAWANEKKTKVVFSVIGSGDRSFELAALEIQSDYFSYKLCGDMNSKELDTFLSSEADLLFAMGTSALEGAKLGVPTMLLDFAYGHLPKGYSPEWLHSTNCYSLGAQADFINVNSRETLFEKLDDFEKKFHELSLKASEYAKKNHSIDVIANNLIQLSVSSKLSYLDLINNNFSKKPMYYVFWKWFKQLVLKS